MDASTGSCALVEGLRLGQAVNLLHAPAAPSLGWEALAAPPRVPLREFPAAFEPAAGSGWQSPAVTLHHGATSIVERLWGCDVTPHRFDGPEFCVRTARLLAGGARMARQQRLREVLGVDVREGRSYLLFELRRVDGRADHEVTARPVRRFFDRDLHLAPDWRRAASRLRPGERIHDGFKHDARIGADAARQYVDAFYDWGTHFVSAVEAGDALVQVVALRPECAADAAACCARFGDGQAATGVAVLNFGRFLRAAYAEEAGPIVSLAGDPALPASLAQGAWSQAGGAGGPNVLAALLAGPAWTRRVLGSFRAAAPLRVELTSLARFMEYYRAINFERILRGALLQRWGDCVRVPLRRMPDVERCLAATVLHGEPAAIVEGELALFDGDRTEGIDAALAGGAGRVASCHRVASLRSGRMWHGSRTLLAQFLDAAADSAGAAVVRVPREQFDDPGIVCQQMVGALVLEDDAGRRDALVDGLRFGAAPPEPATGRPRVQVSGDLHGLAAEAVSDLAPCIRAALARAHVTFVSAAPQDAARGDAARFADWLAELLPADSGDPQVRRLRALALYLARVEAALPAAPARPQDAAVAAARRLHAASAAALEQALAPLLAALPREAPGMAAQAVLAAARPDAPLQAVDAALMRRRGSDAADAALEFLGHEARVREHSARLDAIEAVFATTSFESAEHALGALGKLEKHAEAPALAIETALRLERGGTGGGPGLDAVAACWARFAAARRALAAARAAHCALRSEAWYHAVLAPALYDAPSVAEIIRAMPRHAVEIERHRLHATLAGCA